MKCILRSVLLAVIPVLLAACLEFKAEVRLNPDGSGTLEVDYGVKDEAIARQAGLAGLGSALGGSGPSWAQQLTFDADALRSQLKGLELRSLVKTKKNGMTFMHVEAAFKDLETLARSSVGEPILFERLQSRAVRLHIDTALEELPSADAPPRAWRALAGLQVSVSVTVPGKVESTNAHLRNKRTLTWRWNHHGRDPGSALRLRDGAELVVSGEGLHWTLPRLAGDQLRVLLDRAERQALAGNLKAAWHTLKAYEKTPAGDRTDPANRRFTEVLAVYRAEVAAAREERFYFQCANRAIDAYRQGGLAAANRELDAFHERHPESRYAWKIEAKRDYLGRHARGELTDMKKTLEAIENHIANARFGIALTIIEGKPLSGPEEREKKEALYPELRKAAEDLWRKQHAEAQKIEAAGWPEDAREIYRVIRRNWGLIDYQRRAEAELARLNRAR